MYNFSVTIRLATEGVFVKVWIEIIINFLTNKILVFFQKRYSPCALRNNALQATILLCIQIPPNHKSMHSNRHFHPIGGGKRKE
jgi:hypothetical protein